MFRSTAAWVNRHDRPSEAGKLLSVAIIGGMDILIRDLPEEVVAGIDAKARRLGLSRNEFLRRALASAGSDPGQGDTDWQRFAHTFRDLADPDVMGAAWS